MSLFRVPPARDQLIDTDMSEDNGRWLIDVEGDPVPGDYYVRVTRPGDRRQRLRGRDVGHDPGRRLGPARAPHTPSSRLSPE